MVRRRANLRDLNRTREKILAAALAEFSAKGFAGARVDAIARRARVNKRMLYYCFGAKQELYREIVRRKIADRSGFVESIPDDFGGAMAHIYLSGGTDIEFVRLLEWEAVDLTQLFISMLSLALFPLVMPQIIRLIHGMEPTDRRFMRERENFLRWLGDRLAGNSVDPVVPARVPRRLTAMAPHAAALNRGRSFKKPGQLP